MRTRLSILMLMGLSLSAAPPVSGQLPSLSSKVTERVLSNGLKVLIIKAPDTPMVECRIAYRVGSVNERLGITGISHLHEHMMFKGTKTMGIKPGMLEKDEEYNRRIDALEDEIIQEEAKAQGRDETKLAGLRKQVSDLIKQQQAETIVSEEIWKAYQEAGGTDLNASTSEEMTEYYVTLPRNKIELFLALESDRLQNPVFREFYSERDVVAEERRSMENRPTGFFEEQLNATFFEASPYSYPTVGWMSDITRITKAELIAYRNQYYRPDNAVVILAGDVEVEPAVALVEKYFGAIRNPPGKPPEIRTEEPTPEYYKRINGPNFKVPYIEKRVLARAASNPSIVMMFHTPPVWHEDTAVLDVLARVINARTNKIYLDLVLKKEHAVSIYASAYDSEYDSAFAIRIHVKEVGDKPAAPLAEIENEVWQYLEDLKTVPCDDKVLQRVKNAIEASYLETLHGTNLASELETMEMLYHWQFYEEQHKRQLAVTQEDLMRVARKYFNRNNSVIGVLEREP